MSKKLIIFLMLTGWLRVAIFAFPAGLIYFGVVDGPERTTVLEGGVSGTD